MKATGKTGARVALCGLLLALALILGYVEHLFPLPIGIPGIKLGLANLVILLLLVRSDAKTALGIQVLRILLSSLLFGSFVSLAYSLAGGLLSFAVMLLLQKSKRFGRVGISVGGGVAHNLGQMAVAALLVSQWRILFYLPVLLLAGAITGAVLGLVAELLLKRIPPRSDAP